jgi:hypothetical protein
MKFFFFSMLLLVWVSCRKDSAHRSLIDTDFTVAMCGGEKCAQMVCPNDYFDIFHRVYLARRPSRILSSKIVKIPKIIHQVWLEDKPLPKAFVNFRKKLCSLHPDWEIYQWTAKEVASLGLEPMGGNVTLEERTNNYKAAILDTFGGVIVDPDVELLSSLDELNRKYDFYGGFLPPDRNSPHFEVSASLLAARPGHPIIQAWRKQQARSFSSLAKVAADHLEDNALCTILFPPTYFCPISSEELPSFLELNRKPIKAIISSFMHFLHIVRRTPFSEIRPETVAISFWKGEALKTSEEKLEELARQYKELKEEFHILKERVQIHSQDMEVTVR